MQEQKRINANWNLLYKLGSIAAIGAVLVGIVEIAITFFPGGNASQESVYEWFLFFQQSPFLGLRNLGLLNIFLNTLAIFTYLALYGVHRQTPYQPLAALAVIISFLGIGVFFATNRAFAMLGLSQQFAVAADEAQRAALIAAGQAMLSVGASHSPGTFLAFFLSESAGVLISVVMLRSNVFGRLAAYAGILGFSILLLFEFITSFFSGLVTATMILSMLGGLMSMVWYILIARRLFQLSTE
ncbi:MAG: hypothetical protein ACK2T5_08865 [Anaerolineales bacterium]|jgi:hypothetical protein